jgi:uncharacterized protein
MKLATALSAALLFFPVPLFAQTQSSPQKPAQHAPAASDSKPSSPDQNESTASAEKVEPQKAEAIRKLMDVTGTSKVGDQLFSMVTTRVRSTMSQDLAPDRLQKFMDSFNQNLRQHVSPEQVDEAIIPIYASHFSLEDIQGITQFYESPLGQRVVKNLPAVFQESQSVSAQMVQKSAMDTLRSMSDEYPELKSKLSPEGGRPTPGAGSGERPSPAPEGQPPHLSQPQPQE